MRKNVNIKNLSLLIFDIHLPVSAFVNSAFVPEYCDGKKKETNEIQYKFTNFLLKRFFTEGEKKNFCSRIFFSKYFSTRCVSWESKDDKQKFVLQPIDNCLKPKNLVEVQMLGHVDISSYFSTKIAAIKIWNIFAHSLFLIFYDSLHTNSIFSVSHLVKRIFCWNSWTNNFYEKWSLLLPLFHSVGF